MKHRLAFDGTGLLSDIRHAARLYLKTPASTAFAVGGLAAAIACVSALLPLFSDLMLKPHPGFSQSDRLMTIGQSNGGRFSALSAETIDRLRTSIPSIEVIAGVFPLSLSVDVQGRRDSAAVELVTRGYFDGLQPPVLLGRGFSVQDNLAGSEPVAVISHALWQRKFGGRIDAVGQTITVSGRPRMMVLSVNRNGRVGAPAAPSEQSKTYRVVGVMAPESAGTFDVTTDVWLAYEQAAPLFVAGGGMSNRIPGVNAIARAKRGANIEVVSAAVQEEFKGIVGHLGMLADGHAEVLRGVARDPLAQRDAQRQVRLLLSGGILLALVAAANVSLFLLSRAPSRHRELSIRSAVGASQRRLIRQLATESAVLVVIAALLGWFIGLWLGVFMQEQPLLSKAQWRTVSPFDWQVLAMVSGLALALTLLVAIAPIMGLRSTGIAAGAKMLSGQASLSQRLAGVVQIAIAGVVMSAAVAFVWHLRVLATADVGFSADGVLVVSSKPGDARRPGFMTNPQEIKLRRERQRGVLAAIPGVEAAAFASAVPGEPPQSSMRLAQPGAADAIDALVLTADSAHRSLLGMHLVSGADIDPSNTNGVLVNETFARLMWNRVDVAGEMIGPSGMKVVGVVGDVSYTHPADKARPMIYRASGFAGPREYLLARTSLPPAELRRRMREKIASGELEFDMDAVQPLDDVWSKTLAADRARSILTSAAAAIVVLLAALGFYSTQSYLVNAGRREYAIRAAVGAGPRALGRLVLARGIVLGLPGLALAILLGFIAVAWLRDGFVSAAVSSIAVVAITASALSLLIAVTAISPARRARRTEPAPQLRQD